MNLHVHLISGKNSSFLANKQPVASLESSPVTQCECFTTFIAINVPVVYALNLVYEIDQNLLVNRDASE